MELDYKGHYKRYALTKEQFGEEFGDRLNEDMPLPSRRPITYTLRPLVHICYQLSRIHDRDWFSFFFDMESGLPESDIESGNLAYIDETEMPDGQLKELVAAIRELNERKS